MQKAIIKMEDSNELLKQQNNKVCVFGQGFVGLPLTLSYALRGFNAVGVDINAALVANINRGITSHAEKFHDKTVQEILKIQLAEKRYMATTDSAKAVRECKHIIVTVGIPCNNGCLKMDYLEDSCRVIGKNLKKEDLVIIRSTVIPGTTEEFVLPILEKESDMKAGKDFYLAYVSERIAEGSAFDEFENMPTLVGAVNESSLHRAMDLLAVICRAEIIPAYSIKEVETSKIFENIQRDVNIAMVQEFARFTEVLGMDIFEVIKLANTHKRVKLLVPGAGVGGYCIPNAYYYLEKKALAMGMSMDLLKLAREKNCLIPQFIVNKTEELLKKAGKEIKTSNIAVFGLAMKDYSNDARNSPSVEICCLLIERGACVRAFDPLVEAEYEFKTKTQDEALQEADAALILVKQEEIYLNDVEHMVKRMNKCPVCIDVKGLIDIEEAQKHDLKYWRI